MSALRTIRLYILLLAWFILTAHGLRLRSTNHIHALNKHSRLQTTTENSNDDDDRIPEKHWIVISFTLFSVLVFIVSMLKWVEYVSFSDKICLKFLHTKILFSTILNLTNLEQPCKDWDEEVQKNAQSWKGNIVNFYNYNQTPSILSKLTISSIKLIIFIGQHDKWYACWQRDIHSKWVYLIIRHSVSLF